MSDITIGNSMTGFGKCRRCGFDNAIEGKYAGETIICVKCNATLRILQSEISEHGIKIHLQHVLTFCGYGRCPNCHNMINLHDDEITEARTFVCDACNCNDLVVLVSLNDPHRCVLTFGRIYSR